MTKYRVFQDGDQWCATLPNFVDLQTSPAGFGATQADATIDLLEKLSAAHLGALRSVDTGNNGSCGDCESNRQYIADYLAQV